eukprot:scaffold4452_cov40-Cyclotella_meneghiniana.AAC.3
MSGRAVLQSFHTLEEQEAGGVAKVVSLEDLVNDKVTAVAFVDDILFWSTDEAYINELGSKLRKEGLLLEEDGDAAGYLGVEMTKTEEGLIEMKTNWSH